MATPSGRLYEIAGIAVSSTLTGIERTLDSEGPVTAYQIVERLFATHPEYASRRGRPLPQPAERNQIRQPVASWVRDIRPLFDELLVPELNGRIVVLGLALLDDPLARELSVSGLLDALVGEIVDFYTREMQRTSPEQTSTVSLDSGLNSAPRHLSSSGPLNAPPSPLDSRGSANRELSSRDDVATPAAELGPDGEPDRAELSRSETGLA